MIKQWLTSCVVTILMAGAPAARAQFAVIDVGAIAQLVQQLQALEDELAVARDQLDQARQAYQSITGTRGMERLLSGVVRNYLPEDWDQLVQVMQDTSANYGLLAAGVRGLVRDNAVLTEAQLAAMLPEDRRRIESLRNATALHQSLARTALQTTSARFESIQRLIDAIPNAADQKAILDLQARIAAEQNMLLNEQTKLQSLYDTAQAGDRTDALTVREQVIAGHGRFENRFHPAP